MADCPICFGEGQIDMRDSDALIGEHLSSEEIAIARTRGFVYPVGLVTCQFCAGTGGVTEEQHKNIRAVAAAEAEQTIAKLRERGIL